MQKFIKESEERKKHIDYIKQLEKILSNKSKQVLGKCAHLVIAPEFEFAAVASGEESSFPERLKGRGEKKILAGIFEGSPYIREINAGEESFPGATEKTPDGNYAKQLEAVFRHRKLSGRFVTPTEIAKILEILPQILDAEAPKHGLKRVDFSSVPFTGDTDLPNACQFNINLVAEDGTNFYADKDKRASPFHICCIKELLNFEQRGGLAIYVPTEQAYQRLLRNCVATIGGHGVKPRRQDYNTGTIFIRGKNYDVARREDTRKYKHIDNGGIRTEHRLPCPEAVLLAPNQSPYLIIESYLLQHIKALDTFASMSDAEKAVLTPEILWENPLEPFPRTFAQAKRNLEESTYLQKFYPEIQRNVLKTINEEQKTIVSR